jgi:hypothetical protein
MNPLNISDDTPRQARHLSQRLGQLAARSQPQETDDGPPSIVSASRLPNVLAQFLRRKQPQDDAEDKLRVQQVFFGG